MRLAALLFVLTACGRLGFAPTDESLGVTGCAVAHPDLVACWTFNDSLIASPSSVTASGVNVGYRAGLYDAAVHLDAASVLTVPESQLLDVQHFTLMAWVQLEQLPTGTNRAVIFDNATQYALFVHPTGVGCAAATRTLMPPATVSVAEWHHFACVLSPTALTVYLDGMPLGQSLGTTAAAQTGTAGSRIGGNVPDMTSMRSDLLLGDIDDLQIFDVGLTDQDICAAAGSC